jgi:hypothetical protein
LNGGDEMNLNFAPVIYYPEWQRDRMELLQQIDATIRDEAVLWTPQIQETKVLEGGGVNVRYKHGFKGQLVAQFKELLAQHLSYCRARYAF